MEGVLPFPAMMAMECINVGLNTLFKAATAAGMSHHVFVVYSYSFAALLLLPSPFISRTSTRLPPLNFSITSKIALLGLIGYRVISIGFLFVWIFELFNFWLFEWSETEEFELGFPFVWICELMIWILVFFFLYW